MVFSALLFAVGRALEVAAAEVPALPEQLRPSVATSSAGVVVAGCPEAARAGAAVLEAGGNAVDAAVAAAFALGVAEPGQSGLGGQTYMLICLRDGRCTAIDGSCLAPLRVSRPDLDRLAQAGELFGYKLVAAPSTLATLAYALERYGTMELRDTLAPAISLADAGTPFTANQQHFLDAYIGKVRENRYLANLVLDDGLYLRPLDHVYCNPDLAATLRRIAAGGPALFYRGAIADEIEADLIAGGGYVRKDDLARVGPVEREPVRSCYRDHEVVAFPFPGGGVALLATLNVLARFPAELLRDDGADAYQLQLEATRLAIAHEHSEQRLTPETLRHLLAEDSAAELAARILPDRALAREELDDVSPTSLLGRDTTHLSVADRFGNVVSLTQSLGHGFGACVATPGLGFAYNCMLEGYDRSRSASRSYLRPLQAPYTTMTPAIVFRDARAYLVLGGVGSARITSSLVLTLVNVIDKKMSLPDAVAAPRVLWGGNLENVVYVELAGGVDEALAEELRRRGYANVAVRRFPGTQSEIGFQGCVNAIALPGDGLMVGAGDPRRQGTAVPAVIGGPGTTP